LILACLWLLLCWAGLGAARADTVTVTDPSVTFQAGGTPPNVWDNISVLYSYNCDEVNDASLNLFMYLYYNNGGGWVEKTLLLHSWYESGTIWSGTITYNVYPDQSGYVANNNPYSPFTSVDVYWSYGWQGCADGNPVSWVGTAKSATYLLGPADTFHLAY
jgi:hypothetical protein